MAPPGSVAPLVPPDPKIRRVAFSEFILGGRIVHRDVLEEIYAEINERFGSNAKLPD